MRALLSLILLCFLSASLRAETGEQHAQAAARGLLGQPAPPLVLKTIDGQTIDLASLYGRKAVYLEFWATWCVPCRQQMPHLKQVYAQAGQDLAVIAVNVGFDDSVAAVREYRRALGLDSRMPIVFDADGAAGTAFHLRVTPQHVVIGRDGRILFLGHEANAKLDAALRSARAEPPAPMVMARAVAGHAVERPLAAGDRVPALTVSTLDGVPFPLRAPDGRPTVLVFLSPWCETYLAERRVGSRPALAASCRAAREQMAALSHDVRVRWLGVASNLWTGRDDLRAWQRKYQVAVPLALDGSGRLFRLFRVMHVPTVLVLDAQGRIVRRVEGVDPRLGAELETLGRVE
ncbi:TlpA family protein disulfide reductase [Rhodanobacter aciditrophus]|uniref:TlpA family protein disulfide reductase n=1 Tax=Rhodanobacter aciditrophus TaxID=1623218 RepID=UPI003CF2F3BD